MIIGQALFQEVDAQNRQSADIIPCVANPSFGGGGVKADISAPGVNIKSVEYPTYLPITCLYLRQVQLC